MFTTHQRRLAVILPAAIAALVLAGCSSPAPGSDQASVDAAAAKFVACLNQEGQTAKILDSGQVGMLLAEQPELGDPGGEVTHLSGPDGGADAPGFVAVFMDEDGQWMAPSTGAMLPEEGGLQAAWTECEVEVPEFTQPEPDMQGAIAITREDVIEAGLDFAECARSEGWADFADPDADGMLTMPAGITEDELRSLLDACVADEPAVGPNFTMESLEALDFDWMSVLGEHLGMSGATTTTVVP